MIPPRARARRSLQQHHGPVMPHPDNPDVTISATGRCDHCEAHWTGSPAHCKTAAKQHARHYGHRTHVGITRRLEPRVPGKLWTPS